MEPDNSHIGKQFRDAFAEFKQEPSPELWNKIATHPDFPVTPAKPAIKWGKIIAGSAALIAVVSIVLVTLLPTPNASGPEIKQNNKPATTEQKIVASQPETTPVATQSNLVKKESLRQSVIESGASDRSVVSLAKESVAPEKTSVFHAKLNKQPVIQPHTPVYSQNNPPIVAQRPNTTNSSVKELQTSPSSTEPLSASSDTMLCKGESMILLARGGDFYSWNTGETSSSIQINPTELTTYTVTVTSQSGRQLIKEIRVKVVDCQPLAIPNAFTPNADGINDIFEVYGNDIQDFSMIILTRTGQIVFESKDIKAGWDGSIKGKPAELGVYIYRIQFTDQNGTERKQNGQITLLR